MSNGESQLLTNFIQEIITKDKEQGINDGRVHTRFPPEPNGYLHIGHAKAILLNYGLAHTNGGLFNLRFDDTNPAAEEQEFVDAILNDIKWLGADWEERLFFCSDYFDHLYDFAIQLIEKGLAYVCDLSQDEIREHRGTLKEPGKNSPYRDRSVDENLDLFKRMHAGEFAQGSRVLRAKINMASPNINMRDPVIYRVLHAHHHRTGDKWHIYPMYDFSHPLSDALESITHSCCSLEYADHRPLYDWFLDNVDYKVDPSVKGRPRQWEFARLNLSYTVMSKRKLRRLVEEGYVAGWDDPRMPTVAGLRRRGYTPDAIRDFCHRIGVARADSVVDLALLEHCIREDLNKRATRVMAVLRPLKVVITNYPEDHSEWLELENNPELPETGKRQVPFSKVVYIEQEDFMENPPKKFHRLSPGNEVRLKGAYIIKCEEVIKDPATGEVVELLCTYDPDTKSGGEASGRKVKGTSHWVSAAHAVPATVRIYENLFLKENPDDTEEGADFISQINTNSLETLTGCMMEPSLQEATAEQHYQFLRQGYFCLDTVDSKDGQLVFNRIVNLRDSWAKIKKTQE